MTYSVAALDRASGQLLVAVQSCHPAVGAIVPHVRDGVGAVLTQARGEPRLAVALLDGLQAGQSPADALAQVLARDDRAEERQLAVLAQDGRGAASTGTCCVPFAGHHVGEDFVVAANLAATEGVVAELAQAMSTPSAGSATDRLLGALRAAQGAGGDLRGMMSAAFVASAPASPAPVGALTARIDVSRQPLVDLARAVHELRAFQLVGSAAAQSSGPVAAELLLEVRAATEDLQTLFWFSLDVLADRLGDYAAAAALMSEVTCAEPRWGSVLDRIPTRPAVLLREHLDRPGAP
jgi:uncharacterized Ntn-hydrolase superfamily protein